MSGSTLAATQATTSSFTTSSQTLLPSSSAPNMIAASVTSAAPISTATVVVQSSSSIPKGAITAGIICGILVLAILAAMLWYFCRRRKQLVGLDRESSTLVGLGSNGSEKFAMDHSVYEESRSRGSRRSSGIFPSFGAYRETPSMGTRNSWTRQSSDRSMNCSSRHTIEPQDEVNVTIRDPEKAILFAPPAHEHPAYHPLPGQTANIPVYSPSQHSAHQASRSASTREPAYNSLPSQVPDRSDSHATPNPTYSSVPPDSSPEHTCESQSSRRRGLGADLDSREPEIHNLSVPEQSPELPDLTFSPISLDTDTHSTSGPTYKFPSPSDMEPVPLSPTPSAEAPIPITTHPIDMVPFGSAIYPLSSQISRSIESFRPTPLSATEIAEIAEIAEIGTSISPFRPTSLSEIHISPTPEKHSEATEYPFETPSLATSGSEQPGFTPFRTPSLSRVTRNITSKVPAKSKEPEVPPISQLPGMEGSPTPPPLQFKKRSTERPALPRVSTIPYTPPKKFTLAKDLPFNYITLPSPQSPATPSAIKSAPSQMDAIVRTASTYSIPIGFAQSPKQQNGENAVPRTDLEEVLLTHNHSRQWSESDREHVMSWATFSDQDSGLMEGDDLVSPIVAEAQAQKVERMDMVESVHVSSGRLVRKKTPTDGLRHELDGLMKMEKEETQSITEGEQRSRIESTRQEDELKSLVDDLKKKNSQQNLKESRTTPTKPDLRRTSRISFREKKTSIGSLANPKQSKPLEKIEGSPTTEVRDEVSPLFSPVQQAQPLSPLTPRDEKIARQSLHVT